MWKFRKAVTKMLYKIRWHILEPLNNAVQKNFLPLNVMGFHWQLRWLREEISQIKSINDTKIGENFWGWYLQILLPVSKLMWNFQARRNMVEDYTSDYKILQNWMSQLRTA